MQDAYRRKMMFLSIAVMIVSLGRVVERGAVRVNIPAFAMIGALWLASLAAVPVWLAIAAAFTLDDESATFPLLAAPAIVAAVIDTMVFGVRYRIPAVLDSAIAPVYMVVIMGFFSVILSWLALDVKQRIIKWRRGRSRDGEEPADASGQRLA